MTRLGSYPCRELFGLVLCLLPVGSMAAQQVPSESTEVIVERMGELESNRDPKCYATAARLEDFMFGTPLEEQTRFLKADLQRDLVAAVWREASAVAAKRGLESVDETLIREATEDLMSFVRLTEGGYLVDYTRGPTLEFSPRDADHYLSIAYGFRAVLAAQQNFLLSGDPPLPLTPAGVEELRTWLDLLSLGVLHQADEDARKAAAKRVTPATYETAWNRLVGDLSSASEVSAGEELASMASDFRTIRSLIAEKLESFEAYNDVSQQVFLRNLQVYFARYRWPTDPDESATLRESFNASMLAFLEDILLGAQTHAFESGRRTIGVEDVHRALQAYLPYIVNEYEDVIYFPSLGPSDRITLEAYDTDAFRDSGLHWRYLDGALDRLGDALTLEPDPFAAELLTEGVAQFGVLVLRAAGMVARQTEAAETLSLESLEKGFEVLSRKTARNDEARQKGTDEAERIRSAEGRVRSGSYFRNVTESSGVEFEHRSSDWLSRQLRSYLLKDETTGTLTIPPAFGGGGIAAGDIDGDGVDDLLILSGSGNGVFLGRGDGTFEDVSHRIPVDRVRSDNTYGEPRQPVLADLDNDGDQDILITYANDDHLVLRNDGDLEFIDVSETAGLGGAGLIGGPATVVDLDNDGLLDLYIGYFGNYLEGELPNLSRRNLNGSPNRLFRNLGDFEFRDVTEGSGVDNTGWTQAMSHTDFDGDGLQDLIAGNDFGINVWLRNQGDWTFTDWADRLGTGKPSFTMNVGIADLNADRLPDVYISNIVTLVKDEKYVLPDESTEMRFDPEKLARMRVVEANDLFLSRTGGGGYELSELVGPGFSSTGWSWDADFFDFDHDGDDDLYVLNGMNEYMVYSDVPYYTAVGETTEQIVLPVAQVEPNVFFLNEGGGLTRAAESGLEYLGNSRSAVYLDIDLDGDLDIVVNDYHGPASVYENRAGEGNWLKVRLVGNPAAGSNRDAIGARLIVTDETGLYVWREIHGTEGYLSVHPREQHFGVGDATRVDLEIRWPNGAIQKIAGLEVNQRHEIVQVAPDAGRFAE